ncbi:MAG: hypothetical protein ACLSH6_07720 [Limosilactobacillus pontis]
MEAFEKDLNVITSRRIADLYVLPFKHYYRLMVAQQGQLKLFKEVPTEYGLSTDCLPEIPSRHGR